MTDIDQRRRTLCMQLLGGLAGIALGGAARARPSVDESARVFRLDGADVTYAFGVNGEGQLQTLYWGSALAAGDTLPTPVPVPENSSNEMPVTITPLEFPGFGGGLTVEPALKVTFPDGVRDLVLRYVDHQVGNDRIVVRLKDVSRAVHVSVTYAMDAATGIVARSATVENRTAGWIQLDQLAAASLNLPYSDDYRLSYLTGRWAGEFALQTRPIVPGSIVIESRKGVTSHQANPWIAISRAGTQEEAGPVWFGALGWSGSWRIHVDMDALGGVRTTAGYNPFDFAYRLKPGESLASPVFHAGYSGDGFGGASRMFHRYQRERILPGAPSPRLRPVLYNSWEATLFAVDEAGQTALAEKAASIGVERFVMDDGWFGARNGDKAGLGDWVVNRKKFPNGLAPLIRRVNDLGMEFGLWVEPEMVNPDSDLYRAHPDWVINFKGRPRSEARNQLVLNLARRDVYEHLLKMLDKLLTDHNIAFLKWDHNRAWSEPGWPEAAPAEQQRLYVAYVENLYKLLAELRRRHPKLEIESCASGGGRVDLGIMALTDQVWTSDNTDPLDRLLIQDGFSRAYAPAIMMAWVTDAPNFVNKRVTSLEYRFLSAMQGGLGIGANLNHWKDDDFAKAKRLVAEYKTIRMTVQQGNLYRLVSPQGGSARSATLSVAQDAKQAVLFAFLHSGGLREARPRIQLRGLDPKKTYALRAISGGVSPRTPKRASGAYWMGHGLDVVLEGDFQAAAFVLDGA
ncbi:alpha-galactosidase [Massilia dura]|uniref:Alpha-galactosidase n=1 Tax=Pseudoduganella dura TaxID=321982 RepID=A0A6I3X7I9_9BURK|nr:alpha-galactosidase [Pseudoduganella dura]MUI11716.1 alpha-galactosidase [Pseudoduganella dura]GGX78542.1 alpha-galactosidase [Pseudoduganella dura]